MRKRRILSLLLAVAVTATMLIAVPLTASAESGDTVYTWDFTSSEFFENNISKETPNIKSDQEEETAILSNPGSRLNKNTSNIPPLNAKLEDGGSEGCNNALKFDVPDGSTATLYIQVGSGSKSREFKLYKDGNIESPVLDQTIADSNKFYIFTTKLDCGQTYYFDSSKQKFLLGKIVLIVTPVDSQPETHVILDKSEVSISEGHTAELNATVIDGENEKVTWSIDGTDYAEYNVDVSDGNKITITGNKAGNAQITAKLQSDNSKSATCNVTVKPQPIVPGVVGAVDQLRPVTETTTFEILDEAVKVGADTSIAPYENGKLYFEGYVASAGSASNRYLAKTSYDVDNNAKNSNQGISVNANEVFAVKLSMGSEIKVNITSTSTSATRHGKLLSAPSSSDYLVQTDDLKSTTNPDHAALMTYTAKSEDEIVYISADGECVISQIQVTVPDSAEYFGNGKADSGWYEKDGAKEGVIRFLQQFKEQSQGTVKKYGFYFIDPKGNIEKAKITEEKELTDEGIYADLYGIMNDDTKTYSAKAFVTIDDGSTETTYWSGKIDGSISDWTSDEYKIDNYEPGK